MRVFVTGGSGFIGGALVTRLVERGDDVVALARSEAAARGLESRGARVVRGDVLDEDALARGMDGAAVVFHVAGLNTLLPADEAAMADANVRAPAAVVRAAARAGVGRVVHTSSAATLGEERGTVGSETSPHRGWFMSAYERTKHDGELAALTTARRHGVDLVSVNPSSVQGPGRAGGTGRILLAYLNGRLPVFVDAPLSLVDIADCVEGHLLAAERGVPGRRYVLSGPALRSVDALALVSDLTGVRHRVRVVPPRAAMAAATVVERAFTLAGRRAPVSRAMVRTMLHGHTYDGSRATRELGLQYTPIRETLARTVGWAVAEGHVRRPLPGARAPESPRKHPERSTLGQQASTGVEVSAMERRPDPDHPDHPDFARGERTGPEDEDKPDFARGERTLPPDADRPDFARGERDLPEDENRPDFARGERTRPAEGEVPDEGEAP